MFGASSLRRRPCINASHPAFFLVLICLSNKSYYGKQSEPGATHVWHFHAWNISRRQRGFSPHCLDAGSWVEALLYVLAQSLVSALHSVTLSALANSELQLSQKIDFSALYPSHPAHCPPLAHGAIGSRPPLSPHFREVIDLSSAVFTMECCICSSHGSQLFQTQCNTWMEAFSMELLRCCGLPWLKNKEDGLFVSLYEFEDRRI